MIVIMISIFLDSEMSQIVYSRIIILYASCLILLLSMSNICLPKTFIPRHGCLQNSLGVQYPSKHGVLGLYHAPSHISNVFFILLHALKLTCGGCVYIRGTCIFKMYLNDSLGDYKTSMCVAPLHIS